MTEANPWAALSRISPEQLAALAKSDPRAFQRYKELIEQEVWEKCKHDPLLFVQTQFNWGEGQLSGKDGPDVWQREQLELIRDNLAPNKPILSAVSSGKGVGKSTLISWIALWGITTMEDARGVLTANTGTQLETKTWPELAKWFRLFKRNSSFSQKATILQSEDLAHARTWRLDAITWNEENVEAFAGLHNEGKRIVLLMDEASAIADKIWETSEGILSDRDTEIIWFAFGNPTRNTGRFRECFGRYRHRWITRQIDSRTVKITNKDELDKRVIDYGEDSDYVRVNVRGVFPRASSTQLIPIDVVEAAASDERDPPTTVMDPLIMAVDVARFGDDQSVIGFRRGRDARTIKPKKYRGIDTMQLAAQVAELYELHRPDAIFIDEGGVGGGVVDRCRYLRLPVTGVQFGAKADRSVVAGESEGRVYANKRAEMWGVMAEWLRSGAIPNDPEMIADLSGVEYGYVMRDGRDAILLEKKEDMKKRGLASPDNGDMLALTFAYPVQPSRHSAALGGAKSRHQVEYNPFSQAWSPQKPNPQRERQEYRYGGNR